MPVTPSNSRQINLLQRAQYAKGGWGRRYWDFRDRAILRCLVPSDIDILDLGCGEGLTLEKVRARFPQARLRGVDLLPDNIEICRQHHLPAEPGSAYQLTAVADSSQDAVLLIEVIEHLDRPEAALDEIRRILKPGGKLMLVGIPREDRVSFAIDKIRRKEITIVNIRRQNRCTQKAIDLVASGKIQADFMVTHRFKLDRIQEAFELVAGYRDGVVKAMIEV